MALLGLAGLVVVALVSGSVWLTLHQAPPAGVTLHQAAPAGVITEFPLSTPQSQPFGITAGPDGNLWFAEADSNKIGRISPSGSITEFPIPTPQSGPLGITAGPNGNLWFTEYFGNKIGRITTGK